MSKIIFIFIICVASFLSFSTAGIRKRFIGHGHCSLQTTLKIHQCMQSINDYALSLKSQETISSDDSKSPISLPILHKESFKKMCKIYGEYENCTESYVEECPKDMGVVLLNSTYGYICKEAYDTYLENAECSYNVEKLPSVKECKIKLIEETLNLAFDFTISSEDKLAQSCSSINKYVDCTRLPIKENCGLKVWNMNHRVAKNVLKAIMPTCSIKTHKQKYVVKKKQQEIYFF